jgi:ComF family protein
MNRGTGGLAAAGFGGALLDLLLPPACLACRGRIPPGDSARLVCRPCRMKLRTPPAPICQRCGAPRLRTGREVEVPCPSCRLWPPALRVARTACLLVEPADTIVHHLKYRGWATLAPFMAERMAAVTLPQDVAEETTLCIPVPTTASRLRERGYNQAELIAAAFAERTGRRLCAALQRSGAQVSQISLQPAARGANVAGAFAVEPAAARLLHRQHVLLIDDVMTTGATAVACVEALTDAGARCVSVIAFARALTAPGLTRT